MFTRDRSQSDNLNVARISASSLFSVLQDVDRAKEANRKHFTVECDSDMHAPSARTGKAAHATPPQALKK